MNDDFIVRRFVGGGAFEDAQFLQRQGEIAKQFMEAGGHDPLFGVSGWIVSDVSEPLPVGHAKASALAAAGFRVVRTPQFIGPGHVTILLADPVDDEQAARFNAAFGRVP